MEATSAAVWIFGMLTVVSITAAIVWGVLQHAKIQAQARESDPALPGDVAALRDQVEVLQQQLSDVHDRLDFAERMLAQGRVPDQLPRG